MAGPRDADAGAAAGARLRRQSWRRRARRLGLSGLGDASDGREFCRGRRGDQSNLHELWARRSTIVELDLDRPTEDFTEKPAMEEATLLAYFLRGMDAVAPGTDLLCIGEMGIGNSTSAAAIYCALYGGKAGDWVGRGAGVDDRGLARKIELIDAAIALHKEALADPLEVLRRLGGHEIAAMAGAIVAARLARIPVLLDGYIACAAAAVLAAQSPQAIDHCLAGHLSGDGAHREVLARLGKRPLLDLGLRLGEGSGAALAAGVVKAALACHTGMATFAEAQVAGKIEG